jgi:hypothetical protein
LIQASFFWGETLGVAQSRDEFVCSAVVATHKFIPTVTKARF